MIIVHRNDDYPHLVLSLQGEKVDVLQPGRTLVSRGILVLQNITREDAGVVDVDVDVDVLQNITREDAGAVDVIVISIDNVINIYVN